MKSTSFKVASTVSTAILAAAILTGSSLAGPITGAASKNHSAGSSIHNSNYYDPALPYSYDFDYNDAYGNYNPYYDWTLDAGWYDDWYGDANKRWSQWFANGVRKKKLKVAKSTLSRHNRKQLRMAGGEFSGTITHTRVVTFDDGDKDMLVKIKDGHGRTAVLNLGTVKNVKDQNADVTAGKLITASGRSGRLNDKPILVVYSFSIKSS